MSPFFTLFFSPLLLLTVESSGASDFSDVVACTINDAEIAELQLVRSAMMTAALELKQKQEAGTISEEENALLLLIEIRLYEISVSVSLREHSRFYCLHPEKRPKIQVDPRTVV